MKTPLQIQTEIALQPFFETPWGLAQACEHFEHSLELMRIVVDKTEVASPYHKEAPRGLADPLWSVFSYRSQNGDVKHMNMNTWGCGYALTAEEVAGALRVGLPFETRKGIAAKNVLSYSIRDQFRKDSTPYRHTPGIAHDPKSGLTEFNWTHARMIVAEEFKHLMPVWEPSKVTGKLGLVTTCYARIGGLAVYA